MLLTHVSLLPPRTQAKKSRAIHGVMKEQYLWTNTSTTTAPITVRRWKPFIRLLSVSSFSSPQMPFRLLLPDGCPELGTLLPEIPDPIMKTC